MNKTIPEIKKIKSDIESQILTLLKEFEKVSELQIEYVEVQVDHLSYEEKDILRTAKNKKHRKLKGVLDVTINANIENDPRSVDIPC